jgi:hypothetical protein
MRNIGITTFVTLLVCTAIIGNGHVVLAHNDKYTRDFTNSGNNQEIQQGCGNSCTQTSSNTINPSSGSSGLTSSSPSTSPTASTLTLSILPSGEPDIDEVSGSLTAAGSPVAGATITFTYTHGNSEGGASIPLNLGSVVTNLDGDYGRILINIASQDTPVADNPVTAHYAGAPSTNAIAASNSAPRTPL